MPTSTTRLALSKPLSDGSEGVNVETDINANYDKLDAAIGATPCTSTTRPAAPFQGQLIFETDTANFQLWNGTAWKRAYLSGQTSWVDTVTVNSGGLASDSAFRAKLTADTQYQVSIQNNGLIAWGPGGVTAPDTNIYRGAVNQLKTDDDLVVNGTNGITVLNDITAQGVALSSRPLGVIARGNRTTSSTGTTTAEGGVLRIDSISVKANRLYLIHVPALVYSSTVAGDLIEARFRVDETGAAATVTSTLLQGTGTMDARTASGFQYVQSASAMYIPAANVTASILLTQIRTAGTGTVNFSVTAAQYNINLLVIDMGVAPSDTGVDI